jgi:transcriptional regulator with XRE-family HTH domain
MKKPESQKILVENIKTPQQLGLAVRRLRKELGLGQKELSVMASIRQPTVSELEKGKGTLETFFKVLQAMGSNLSLGSKGIKISQVESKSSGKKMLNLLFSEEK